MQSYLLHPATASSWRLSSTRLETSPKWSTDIWGWAQHVIYGSGQWNYPRQRGNSRDECSIFTSTLSDCLIIWYNHSSSLEKLGRQYLWWWILATALWLCPAANQARRVWKHLPQLSGTRCAPQHPEDSAWFLSGVSFRGHARLSAGVWTLCINTSVVQERGCGSHPGGAAQPRQGGALQHGRHVHVVCREERWSNSDVLSHVAHHVVFLSFSSTVSVLFFPSRSGLRLVWLPPPGWTESIRRHSLTEEVRGVTLAFKSW